MVFQPLNCPTTMEFSHFLFFLYVFFKFFSFLSFFFLGGVVVFNQRFIQTVKLYPVGRCPLVPLITLLLVTLVSLTSKERYMICVIDSNRIDRSKVCLPNTKYNVTVLTFVPRVVYQCVYISRAIEV